MESLVLLLLCGLLGAILGCATGLLPSLHVNTLAVLLVALAPAINGTATHLGLSPDQADLVTMALILAISISHTFVNIIPATYLGAPDEDTALTVLPAHRLLLRGYGYRAIRLNAYASFYAVLASLLLIWPAKWILAAPLNGYRLLERFLVPLLLLLAFFLVLREPAQLGPESWTPRRRRRVARLAALGLFLATGVYGLLLFRLPYAGWLPLPPSPLLPALGGLFGAATLVEALAAPTRIPHQYLDLHDHDVTIRDATGSLAAGVGAGASMSLLPGLTNATATAVAALLRRGNDASILITLGAVNTANAVFNLIVLYLFARTRSGAVVAVQQLLPIDSWTHTFPAQLASLLQVVLAAAALSLVLTLLLGRLLARRIHVIPYRGLVVTVLAYLVITVVVFTGFTGLLVFVTGCALGWLPIRLGLQRTHLTGVLLVPVLVYAGS